MVARIAGGRDHRRRRGLLRAGRSRPGVHMTSPSYETILVTRDDRVGTITLNRPKAMNAINSQVMNEVTTAAAEFENDQGIGGIVVTGNEKAFAAGPGIKEMAELSFADVFSAVF